MVLVEGFRGEAEEAGPEGSWEEEALELARTLPVKEAARQISAKWNRSRREVYQYLLRETADS